MVTNKGCPLQGAGWCTLTGIGAFNNVTTIDTIVPDNGAYFFATPFVAHDSDSALYLHSVPSTALGFNPEPTISGVNLTTNAVRFTPVCKTATAADFVSNFPSPDSGGIHNSNSNFWVYTDQGVGLRTGMNFSQFNGGGAICDVQWHYVEASFTYARNGQTWGAFVYSYVNATSETSISMTFPGELRERATVIHSVVLLSPLFRFHT